MSEISTPLDTFRPYLEKIAVKHNLRNWKCGYNHEHKTGVNYIGILRTIYVEGTRDQKVEKINIIVKCLPPLEVREALSNAGSLFQREIYFYKDILPLFEQIAEKHGTFIDNIPKLYEVCEASGDQILFLEDVSYKGYVLKKIMAYDYPHASLLFQHLGRFHSYSFALRDQKPEEFRKFREMKELFFDEEAKHILEGFIERIAILCDVAKKALKNENERYQKSLNDFIADFENNVALCLNKSLAEPYAVITHGDLHANNVLFKYKEGSTDPSHLYIIDFQLSRYSTPMIDLAYVLYACTTQDIRTKYFDKLVDEYYNSMVTNLRKLGSDPEKLIPRNDFFEHLQAFGKCGAFISILEIHYLTMDQSDVQVFGDDIKDIDKRLETDTAYADSVRNALKDVIDRNYI